MARLGKRQPELYGFTTAAELDEICQAHAARHGYELGIFYSNSEGEAINRIYAAVDQGLDGLVMNPAAFIFAGYALRSCLVAIDIPYIEIHMRNAEAHAKSILAPVARGFISGLGVDSYRFGLDAMIRLLENETSWT